MADIELVIKISEVMYKQIKEGYVPLGISKYLKNGAPLPKWHGKLIVEPTEEEIAKTIGGQNDFADCIRDSVKAVFDNAQAIIEADNEVEEGKTE